MKTGSGTRLEKYAEIRRMRGRGYPVKKIAEILGMKPGGVSAIINDPDGSKQKTRRERYRGVCRECGKETDGSSGFNAPTLCASCHGKSTRVWTREMIIDAILRWAHEYGQPPVVSDWPHADREWGRPAATGCYGEHSPFASWADAVEAAGFSRPHTGRRRGVRAWDRESVISAIKLWVEETGELPRVSEWQKGQGPYPVAATVYYYFGTWNNAIQAAGFSPRRSSKRKEK